MLNTSSEFSSIAVQSTSPMADAPVPQPLRKPFRPMQSLRRHWKLATLVFCVLTVSGGALVRMFLGPVYSAEAIVYVSPIFPGELGDNHEHDRQYDVFMEQQIYAVTRYENLRQAIRKYPRFWKLRDETEQDAVARLQKALKAEEMGRSYQMSISLKTRQRDGLAEFLNEITAAYLASAHTDEFYGHPDRIGSLTRDRDQLSATLDADLRRQGALLDALGMAQFDSQNANNPYDTQMVKLREQLAEAHEKRAEADAVYLSLRGKADGSVRTALDEAANAQASADPAVVTLTNQLNNRRAVLMLELNGLTPQNPLYKQAQAELDSIDRQLEQTTDRATTRVVGQLNQHYSSERARAQRLESELQGDLSRTQALAVHAAPKIQQAQLLNDEIHRLQANYALIDDRIRVLELETNSPSSEHVVSWAVPPSGPTSRHRTLATLVVALFSALCALLAALFAESRVPFIYTAEEVERIAGFPPIGMLLHQDDFPAAMRAEYLLRLAGGIDQAHRRSAARTFVFTAAGAGDTREIVQQLGAELARGGLRTLVILVGEAATANSLFDEQQPSGHAPAPELTVSSLHTSVASVTTVSDGDVDTQLFQVTLKTPRGLPAFLRKTSSAYNTILVGADPLMLSAHTEQLVRVADGTVLVVESGRVTRKQFGRAARLLERLKIPGVAIVLSNIRKQRADEEIVENSVEFSQHRAIPT